MRKLVFILCLLYGYDASAQSVIDDGVSYGLQVREAVHIIYPILSVLSPNERSIVRSVQIHVRPGGPWPGPRAGYTDAGTRVILIPERYVAMQHYFIEAVMLAESRGLPHFPEWWISYARWRSAPLYDYEIGGIPKTPLDFYGLPEQERKSFYEENEQLLSQLSNLALVDIILHEIGHHVTNKFYDLTVTPRSVAREIESEVDAWASNVFMRFVRQYPNTQHLDENNLLGRVMAMYFVSELEAFALTARDPQLATHPDTRSRVSDVLTDLDCGVSDAIQKLCSYVRKKLDYFVTDRRDEEHYRRRAEAGEVFALYQLARLHIAKGEYKEGCNWLSQDTELKGSKDGYTMLGWCYSNGYLGGTLSHRQRQIMARVFYCNASRSGWREGKIRYSHLIAKYDLPDYCYR